MLTLKNTLFNAQLRASAANRLDTDSHLRGGALESTIKGVASTDTDHQKATGGGGSTEESTHSNESGGVQQEVDGAQQVKSKDYSINLII